MNEEVIGLIVLSGMVGFIFAVMLICHEDGKPLGLYMRLRCKYGKHLYSKSIAGHTRALYHCSNCKKPRKHPVLQVVDGGKLDIKTFTL